MRLPWYVAVIASLGCGGRTPLDPFARPGDAGDGGAGAAGGRGDGAAGEGAAGEGAAGEGGASSDTCGDGACDRDETCSSCAADCGPCAICDCHDFCDMMESCDLGGPGCNGGCNSGAVSDETRACVCAAASCQAIGDCLVR
jgi:hypothetical protein